MTPILRAFPRRNGPSSSVAASPTSNTTASVPTADIAVVGVPSALTTTPVTCGATMPRTDGPSSTPATNSPAIEGNPSRRAIAPHTSAVPRSSANAVSMAGVGRSDGSRGGFGPAQAVGRWNKPTVE